MTHRKLLSIATAIALAISAINPAALEAQRRQPTRFPRPVPSLSQSESCTAKKVMTVGGMTLFGAIVGMFATMISYPAAVFTHSNAPKTNFLGTFSLIGLVVGVAIAVGEPCDR